MPNISLRSCYDKIGRLIYFGRMLDKIRLLAPGQLPRGYQSYLGEPLPNPLDREHKPVTSRGWEKICAPIPGLSAFSFCKP